VGVEVWWVLGAMCVLAVGGLINAVINDCLPSHFNFTWGLRTRHLIFMSLAIGYGVMMTFTMHEQLYSSVPYFLINIVFIVLAAFVDIQHRFKRATLQQRRIGDLDA
jgi:hypothetical protein